MKKITLLLMTIACSLALFAQQHVVLSQQKTNAELIQNTSQKIVFTNNLEGFEVTEAKTLDGL